jgi:hypothetical protein
MQVIRREASLEQCLVDQLLVDGEEHSPSASSSRSADTVQLPGGEEYHGASHASTASSVSAVEEHELAGLYAERGTHPSSNDGGNNRNHVLYSGFMSPPYDGAVFAPSSSLEMERLPGVKTTSEASTMNQSPRSNMATSVTSSCESERFDYNGLLPVEGTPSSTRNSTGHVSDEWMQADL